MTDYIYTRIDDLKDGNIVHIYGIIEDYLPPEKTQGTDLVMKISVIDSIPWKKKLKITLFKRTLSQFPPIEQIGDIIRCHYIRIQLFEGTLQGLCSKGFSCLIFNSQLNTPIQSRLSSTYHSKALPIKLSHQDIFMVTELRTLIQSKGFPVSSSAHELLPLINLSNLENIIEYRTPLSLLMEKSRVNLLGVIIDKLPRTSTHPSILLITDFTSHSLLDIQLYLSSLFQGKKEYSFLNSYNPKTILPVLFHDTLFENILPSLQEGTLIYLSQAFIELEKHSHLIASLHHPSSSIQPLHFSHAFFSYLKK
jgi:hypothetical protein